jgi:hypothetical protein
MAFEMMRLTPCSSVARGPANVGIVEVRGGLATLVDSGNDDDAGRKLVRSNADHCGGNAMIQARCGCEIWATRAEAAFIENPYLEPSYLWGGFPLPAHRNKFLMARASQVTHVFAPPCELPGAGLSAVPLPGHFMEMAGFMTEDRVFFVADTVASEAILRKYHIFYLYDIEAQIRTLDALSGLDADWYVPSHAEPTRDILPLVAINRAKIEEISAIILDLCIAPLAPDALLARIASRYSLAMNHLQYALIGSTLRSYASWLVSKAKLESRFEDGRLVFQRI